MDKPEYCWLPYKEENMLSLFRHDCFYLNYPKFQILRNEAGEVIRLERVEGDKP